MNIPTLSSIRGLLNTLFAKKSEKQDIFTPSRDWLLALTGFMIVLCFFVTHGLVLYGDVSSKNAELFSSNMNTPLASFQTNRLDGLLDRMQTDRSIFQKLEGGIAVNATATSSTLQ